MILSRVLKKSISFLRRPINESDPQIYSAILDEKKRQIEGINLIPSENYCSNACFSAVGSILNNKYSEGYPGARYYGGTQFVDFIQTTCQKRALKTFRLSEQKWGVNVQALSGSPANFIVYSALLEPHQRLMGLDLTHGGHLTHGFMNLGKRVSLSAKYFESLPYFQNQATGQIDYEALHKQALIYRPKLIIAGTSAYSRLINYKKFRQICDDIGAYLMADMAHISGLVAADLIPSPFEYCDIVTTTTHKTLRGPRGALIFYRVGNYFDKKGQQKTYHFKQKVDSTLFPGFQGGPHNHVIAGIAVSLKQASSQQFVAYQKQVLKNIRKMANNFVENGYQIVSGITENHLLNIDMRSKGIDGAQMEFVCNQLGIYLNKNTVPGDKSPFFPSAIRIGSPAMTTRGLEEKDFDVIFSYLDRAAALGLTTKKKVKGKKLSQFKEAFDSEKASTQFQNLHREVKEFGERFPIPGGLL